MAKKDSTKVLTDVVKDGEVKEINVSENPIHLEKFLSTRSQMYSRMVVGMLYTKFGRTKMESPTKWQTLIDSELSRDLK